MQARRCWGGGGAVDVCWTSFNCQSAWLALYCLSSLALAPLLIPCLSLPLLFVLQFPYVCLFLTKFVGIFVLCSVTFILCLFSSCFFARCRLLFCLLLLGALCSLGHSQLSLYLLFKTIFIDCRRDAKTAKKEKRRESFCYAWLNSQRIKNKRVESK